MEGNRSKIPEQFNWNSEGHPKYPVIDSLAKPSLDQLLRVEFDDESLRDGVQGVERHPETKEVEKYIDIAAKAGLDIVTVGIYSGEDSTQNKTTKEVLAYMRDNHPTIRPVVVARTREADLNYAEECSDINDKTQVLVFQGASPQRLWIQGWSDEHVLSSIGNAVERLAKKEISVLAIPEDASRTPPEFLERFVKVAIEGGAKRIGIADTVGALDQWGALRITKMMRQIMDTHGETGMQMGLDFHNHNDRGLGSANALAAISGGADRIHGVLVGIGERTGNAPLETVMYNVDRLLKDAGHKESRWNLKSIFELALHYSRITGVPIPAHAPLVGENAFRTQAGIHSDAEEKALMAIQEHAAGKSGATKDSIALALDTIAATIYSSVDPRDIGREHDEEIGPMAGGSTVRLWLWHHGYNVNLGDRQDSRIDKILQAAEKKGGTLSTKEITKLIGLPPKK